MLRPMVIGRGHDSPFSNQSAQARRVTARGSGGAQAAAPPGSPFSPAKLPRTPSAASSLRSQRSRSSARRGSFARNAQVRALDLQRFDGSASGRSAEDDEERDGPLSPVRSSLRRFVASQVFELGVAVMVVYSCAAVVVEVEDARHDHGNPFFTFTNHFVTTFFLLEWLARIAVYGPSWLLTRMNVLTTVITWFPGVLVVWILQPLADRGVMRSVELNNALKVLRIIRMLRLLRIVSVFKDVRGFNDMWLLVRGLQFSMNTLGSAMIMIAFVVYMFGVCSVDLIGNADLSSAGQLAREYQERFANLGSAMITMFQIMNSDDSMEITDALHAHLPFIWVYFWVFIALATFVLLNLVTAIIVKQALDITRMDDEAMAAQQWHKYQEELEEFKTIFNDIDVDGDGTLSLKEFKDSFEAPAFRNLLVRLGLSEKQLIKLFELLDTQTCDACKSTAASLRPEDDSAVLDLDEFTGGMSRMQGPATSKDMVMLVKYVDRIKKILDKVRGLPEYMAKGGPAPEEQVSQAIDAISRSVEKRLGKSERELQSAAQLIDRLCGALDACASVVKGS